MIKRVFSALRNSIPSDNFFAALRNRAPSMASLETLTHDRDQGNSPPSKVAKLSDDGEISRDIKTIQDLKPGMDKSHLFTPTSAGITEPDVGITEYIGNYQGFNGLVKNRYEDFLVHEIGLDDQVVEITDLTLPEIPEEPTINLEDYIDNETVEKIAAYNESSVSRKKRDPDEEPLQEVKIDVTEKSKEERTMIHKAVAARFPMLETNTVNDPSDSSLKLIVVKARSKGCRKRSRWPADLPDYLHFHVYKENRDTFEAINVLSGKNYIKPTNFTYAGIKDRRGITCQRMACWRIHPQKLIDAAKGVRPPMLLGNFRFEKDVIRIGDLKGNRFDVVVRSVDAKDDSKDVNDAMTTFKEVGFINYYGLQRFGSLATSTFKIGLKMIKNQWEDAVKLILQPKNIDVIPKRPGARSFNDTMKLYIETKDAKLAFKSMHYKSTTEGRLLRSLAKSNNGSNYLGALCSIPRNTRLFYLHAYQSYLWNLAASYRIREGGGLELQLGDLVIKAEGDVDDTEEGGAGETETLGSESDEDPEQGSESKTDTYDPNKDKASRNKFQPVIVDDSNKHIYSIYDVILPLVGPDSTLPQNSTGEYLLSLLKEDGLTLEDLKAKTKQVEIPGSYRKLLQRPQDVSWTLKHYRDASIPLVPSDRERLGLSTFEKKTSDQEDGTDQTNVAKLQDSDSKLGLVVSFSLPRSCYATMALRQILRRPTNDFVCRTVVEQ